MLGLNTGINGVGGLNRYYERSASGTVFNGSKEVVSGLNVPVSLDITVSVLRIRSGVKLEYAYFNYPYSHLGMNAISAFAILGYEIPISRIVSFVPVVGIGGCTVYTKNELSSYYTYPPSSGVAVKTLLNFEFNYKRVKFIAAPVYTYYNTGLKQAGRSYFHNYGLNIGVKFYLSKAKPKSK